MNLTVLKLDQAATIYGFESILLIVGDNIRVDSHQSTTMLHETEGIKGVSPYY